MSAKFNVIKQDAGYVANLVTSAGHTLIISAKNGIAATEAEISAIIAEIKKDALAAPVVFVESVEAEVAHVTAAIRHLAEMAGEDMTEVENAVAGFFKSKANNADDAEGDAPTGKGDLQPTVTADPPPAPAADNNAVSETGTDSNGERTAVIYAADGTIKSVPFDQVKAGDVFSLAEPDGTPVAPDANGNTKFVATSDAVETDGVWGCDADPYVEPANG